MIEKFPLPIGDRDVQLDDYHIFSSSFAEILLRHIPTVKNVEFFSEKQHFYTHSELFKTDAGFIDSYNALQEGQQVYIIYKGYILLALQATDGVIVAVLADADPLVLQKAGRDWLAEKVDLAEREFHLLKQARVDSQTGLLNLANLHSLLDTQGDENNLMLALVELAPASTTFRYNIKYTHQCVVFLKGFIRGRSILHYLGHNVFALVLQQGEEKTISTLESSLVAYLKKAGCPRVHVGSSVSHLDGRYRLENQGGSTLLDEAYTALHRAVRRGPFCFCEYQHIAHPENQTLAPPDAAMVRKISRWCTTLDSCALVLFRGDNLISSPAQIITPLVSPLRTIETGGDLYVLYPSGEVQEVTKWVKNILAGVRGESQELSVSAGIACYPYANMRKSELAFCCKKALLHAAFFGPSSLAVFDHVTLNISGDVYFGDGDFTAAIKEYKRGLTCCGGDVNLYNSLGVTLAMMNRTKQANESFESALAIDKDNFMALYNLGLSKQGIKLNNEAVEYFGRAYAHRDSEDVDHYLLNDLKLQLGILSCEIGQYESALNYIESWLDEEGSGAESGRVYYYKGLSHFKLGDSRAAMKSLERALRFDGFDDRALNLLGRLYLQEKEGEAIASAYCQKSVELDPGNAEYKLYLAEIYVSIGKFAASRELLKHCLRRKRLQAYSQLLLGEGYLKESNMKRAESWFNKVLIQQKLDIQIKKRAKQGLKSCNFLLRKEK